MNDASKPVYKPIFEAKIHGGASAACAVNEFANGRQFVFLISGIEVSREVFMAALKLSETASMAIMASNGRAIAPAPSNGEHKHNKEPWAGGPQDS